MLGPKRTFEAEVCAAARLRRSGRSCVRRIFAALMAAVWDKDIALFLYTGSNGWLRPFTLATVKSIVSQAARTNADPKEMRKAVESRLFALPRSHDLLSREKWQSAGLLDVLRDALEPLGRLYDRSGRVEISGENIRFAPKAALALGIAFNELATNAISSVVTMTHDCMRHGTTTISAALDVKWGTVIGD